MCVDLHRLVRPIACVLFAATVSVPANAAHETPVLQAAIGPAQARCPAALSSTITRQYRVNGRVRPLLFWTGRRDVGEATVKWSGAPGEARRLELLIGTDPGRAPMRMNRWGYVSETACQAGADLIGVMTQSDEETLDDAQANLTTTGSSAGHPFRAVRATVADGITHTEVLRLLIDENLSYHDLDTLLARLPVPGAVRHAPLPAQSASGFLLAMADVLQSAVTAVRQGNAPAAVVTRAYVYAGRPYELMLRSATVLPQLQIGDRSYRQVVDGVFETRNGTTGAVTRFQMTVGTADGLAGVPLRVVYRPKWWVELELTIAPAPPGDPR
jgi:hypothetical protein